MEEGVDISHQNGIYYRNFDAGNGKNAPEINVQGLDLMLDQKVLFRDLEFSLNYGDKATIVGENGSGKTTFLQLLCGLGNFPISRDISVFGSIGLLPQKFENVNQEELAITALLRSLYDEEIDELLLNRMDVFSSEWTQEFNILGGHEILSQLHKLGLEIEALKRPFKSLSGGEKTKIFFCALSVLEPDFILLDEPTNHLDEKGIEWLDSFLQRYQGGVIVVTHDRALINSIADCIFEISPHTKKFTRFAGGYKSYLEEEEKTRLRLIRERHSQEMELKKLKYKATKAQSNVKTRIIRSGSDRDKLSYNNKEQRAQKGTTSLVNQLSDKVNQLTCDLVDVIPERSHISFDFEDLNSFGAQLGIDVAGLSKSFDKPLFSNISFTLNSGCRLILQGPNGSGKTTLLRLIMGFENPDHGSVTVYGHGRLGYLDQEQENLDLEKSPIELIQDDPLIDTGKANSKSFAIYNLQSFGIYTWHDLSSPLKSLSVGCRRKAQLCQIIMRKSSILILDEPTNHIDFPSLESIEDSLLNFPGIIIAATHDRYFTEKLATKTINILDYQM